MKHALDAVVRDTLTPLAYELVELRVGGSRARPVLDVRIDRIDAQKVSVGDCERASRAIEVRLDELPDALTNRYVLEVSSPGLERPLRTIGDWRRFTGRRANVKSGRFASMGGRAEVEIVNVSENGVEPVRMVVRDLAGQEHTLSLADVDDARLAFHWQP